MVSCGYESTSGMHQVLVNRGTPNHYPTEKYHAGNQRKYTPNQVAQVLLLHIMQPSERSMINYLKLSKQQGGDRGRRPQSGLPPS
jgi:hypothetical protein